MGTMNDIIEDMANNNPAFFDQYDMLAQRYYPLTNAISKAHIMACLELLTESGYLITKVTRQDNLVAINPNVLGFKKKV